MANVHLAFPNKIDGCTLSGGSWLSTLPLNNTKNRRLSKLARSTNILTSSTKFDIDMGASTTVGCVALIAHNLSVGATVRIQGDDANDFSSIVYDSGDTYMWPSGMIPQSLLEWEEDNFWLGTISQQAIAGYKTPFIHFLPVQQNLRYWRVLITDTSNSDGYINLGRVFIGAAFVPTYNISYGRGLVVNDASAIETSLTGEEFFDQKQRYRVHTLSLDFLSRTEAYTNILDMQRNIGTTGEILISLDPDDTSNVPRHSFMGRLQSISPVLEASFEVFTNQMEIREII